jgi:hypothetical protein
MKFISARTEAFVRELLRELVAVGCPLPRGIAAYEPLNGTAASLEWSVAEPLKFVNLVFDLDEKNPKQCIVTKTFTRHIQCEQQSLAATLAQAVRGVVVP